MDGTGLHLKMNAFIEDHFEWSFPPSSALNSKLITALPPGHSTRHISFNDSKGLANPMKLPIIAVILKLSSSQGSRDASPLTISAVPAAIRFLSLRFAIRTWTSERSSPGTS